MRLLRLLVKVVVAAVLGFLCAVVPLAAWMPPWLAGVQTPLVAVLLVVYCGKLLYDTFFYDHYRP